MELRVHAGVRSIQSVQGKKDDGEGCEGMMLAREWMRVDLDQV